eukprot:TRINITY_DN5981_c1_g1_i1.p3 TRINITY_DN5981_c1_g1~~TRINITY_DN5981_c1_g1_i1.p3  ORF type:complete len:129 (-),score=0.17 TRINITY_DN5981_c1_g1_i1:7-393(-)
MLQQLVTNVIKCYLFCKNLLDIENFWVVPGWVRGGRIDGRILIIFLKTSNFFSMGYFLQSHVSSNSSLMQNKYVAEIKLQHVLLLEFEFIGAFLIMSTCNIYIYVCILFICCSQLLHVQCEDLFSASA